MQLIVPFSKTDGQSFFQCAIEIGFDEFVAHKFVFIMLESDLDVFQLMYDERLSLLLYGWEILDIYMQNIRNTNNDESFNPSKSVQTVIKWLARYSLDIWLSTEWENCDLKMRMGLIYCIRRVKDVLLKVPEVALIDWDHMLKAWDIRPWQQRYVSRFLKSNKLLKHSTGQSIEEIEDPASKDDIGYLKEEDILIILLRLVKMLDSYFLEGVKRLSMRVISAWNAVYERAKEISNNKTIQIPEENKEGIIAICHIYLLAVYEMDDNRGFVIDNMMNNVRFYHKNFLEKKFQKPLEAISQLKYTPARFIALTCINLDITIEDFFQMFTSYCSKKNFTSLFGVISQAYVSYILGNQLMEMNAANTDSFNANLESYKRIFNLYLEEREASEMFCRDQLHRQQLQRNSHTPSKTMKNLTDFASKLSKGNRPNNIVIDCDNTEEDHLEDQSLEAHSENSKKTDPVFQNIPDNIKILNYVYEMLANRTFDGWHFAKTYLLLKIICYEMNQIETWRYHPGLTIDFMLNLDIKLSKHYEDLALIFHEYYFLEQEFWLTAFYLNPIRKYYDAVMRCGGRLCRRQNQNDEIIDAPKNDRHDRGHEKQVKNAKYGLLSSTIDVQEIVKITDYDKSNFDYKALTEALDDLKLPERLIKNLITITFLPRNGSFAWIVNWQELRKRCKKLLKYPEYKRHFVELNMAEASENLKFLKIDYEKYKNRPQLDYGTIERGYEILNANDQDEDSDDDDQVDDDDDDDIDKACKDKVDKEQNSTNEDDDDDDDGDDDDDDIDKKNKKKVNSDTEEDKIATGPKKRGRKRKPDAPMSKTELELMNDICSTRRTRSSTAAALATAKENEKIIEDEKNKEIEKKEQKEPNQDVEINKETAPEIETSTMETDLPADLKENILVEETKRITESPVTTAENLNINELMLERPKYVNETDGFKAFTDTWDFDAKAIRSIDENGAILSETQAFLQEFLNWSDFISDNTPDIVNNNSRSDDKEENLDQRSCFTSCNITDNTSKATSEIKEFENISKSGKVNKSPETNYIESLQDGKEDEVISTADTEKGNVNYSEIGGESVDGKSSEEQNEAKANISSNIEEVSVSEEHMTLEADETIAVEEVNIEYHEKSIQQEIAIAAELVSEERQRNFKEKPKTKNYQNNDLNIEKINETLDKAKADAQLVIASLEIEEYTNNQKAFTAKLVSEERQKNSTEKLKEKNDQNNHWNFEKINETLNKAKADAQDLIVSMETEEDNKNQRDNSLIEEELQNVVKLNSDGKIMDDESQYKGGSNQRKPICGAELRKSCEHEDNDKASLKLQSEEQRKNYVHAMDSDQPDTSAQLMNSDQSHFRNRPLEKIQHIDVGQGGQLKDERDPNDGKEKDSFENMRAVDSEIKNNNLIDGVKKDANQLKDPAKSDSQVKYDKHQQLKDKLLDADHLKIDGGDEQSKENQFKSKDALRNVERSKNGNEINKDHANVNEQFEIEEPLEKDEITKNNLKLDKQLKDKIELEKEDHLKDNDKAIKCNELKDDQNLKKMAQSEGPKTLSSNMQCNNEEPLADKDKTDSEIKEATDKKELKDLQFTLNEQVKIDRQLRNDNRLQDDEQLKYDEQQHDDEQLKDESMRKSDGDVKENNRFEHGVQFKNNDPVGGLNEMDYDHTKDIKQLNDENYHKKNLFKDDVKIQGNELLKGDNQIKDNAQQKDAAQPGIEIQRKSGVQRKDDTQVKDGNAIEADQISDNETFKGSEQQNNLSQLENDDSTRFGDYFERHKQLNVSSETQDVKQVKNNTKDMSPVDHVEKILSKCKENLTTQQYDTNDDKFEHKQCLNTTNEQSCSEKFSNNATRCIKSLLDDAEQKIINFETQKANLSTLNNSNETEKNSEDKAVTENSDCTTALRLENILDDESQVDAKSKLKISNEDYASESIKLNVPSITSLDETDKVLSSKNSNDNIENENRNSSVEKIRPNSPDIRKVDSNVSNKPSGDDLGKSAIENAEDGSQDRTTVISFDDNSTNMSEGSLIDLSNKDAPNKSDKVDYEELCRQFELKEAVICIKRLSVNDLRKLRQPCVKLRRMNCESILPQKRSQRNVEHKSYIGIDESSRSSNGSSFSTEELKVKTLIRNQRKRKFSQSLLSSDNEEKYETVKSVRQQTARKKPHHRVSPDRQNDRSKRLIVTPRSASGLKMRISSAPSKRTEGNMELINISSASSSPQILEDSDEDEDLFPIAELLRQDPLYEEEVIICD